MVVIVFHFTSNQTLLSVLAKKSFNVNKAKSENILKQYADAVIHFIFYPNRLIIRKYYLNL